MCKTLKPSAGFNLVSGYSLTWAISYFPDDSEYKDK